MKKFCVAFDLIGTERDYTNIEYKLTELNGDKIQKSVWTLTLNDSWNHKKIKKELIEHFSKEDRLFISRIANNHTIINSLSSFNT
jgi:CRISPR/Cas system-associated endoribonuclease Cas2